MTSRKIPTSRLLQKLFKTTNLNRFLRQDNDFSVDALDLTLDELGLETLVAVKTHG